MTFASVASAQDVGAPAASAAPTSAAPTTDGPPAPPGSAAAPATPPSGAIGGYSYGSSKKKPAAAAGAGAAKPPKHVARHARGAIATLPGFQMLPEGGSRLFVELTASVTVEERAVAGGLTYVLKNARIDKRNNENALITVHFNTPVTRARLLPSGHDLHFVVELRQNVKPTWKLVPAKDGASVLQIDFAGGSYLPNDPSVAEAPAAKPAASAAGKATH
ncbi:MAG: hypothetical protein ABI551_15110 [Polyangiaceae bacterium]